MTSNDPCFTTARTTGSEKGPPFRCFASKTAVLPIIAIWFFAASPLVRLSTMNKKRIGVVLAPTVRGVVDAP